MRVQAAALLLFPVAGPSHALVLETFGPGMASYGNQMCADVAWSWHGDTTESSGQIALALPMTDLEV